MGNVLYILIFVLMFVTALSVTLLAFRFLRRREPEEEPDITQEAEALNDRAEKNVQNAEDIAARSKRLEELVSLQRRARPESGRREERS